MSQHTFTNVEGIAHYIRHRIECPESGIEDLANFLDKRGWKFVSRPDFDISVDDRQGAYIYDPSDEDGYDYLNPTTYDMETWAENHGMAVYERDYYTPKRDLISFLEGWIREGGFVPAGKLEEDYEAEVVVPWIVNRYIIASPGLTQHELGAEMAKRKNQGEVERKYREHASWCGIKV